MTREEIELTMLFIQEQQAEEARKQGYSVYSEFDVRKHKEKYPNYLEVLIEEDGHVVYAVPSHQEKAIALCCNKLQVSRGQLDDMCPQEYYFDFMTWLLSVCNCISVWNDFYLGKANDKQKDTLKMLKLHGVYRGNL